METPPSEKKHDLIRFNPDGKAEVIIKRCDPDVLLKLRPCLAHRSGCLWVSLESGQYNDGDTIKMSDLFGSHIRSKIS
jgi:hypothetical protein